MSAGRGVLHSEFNPSTTSARALPADLDRAGAARHRPRLRADARSGRGEARPAAAHRVARWRDGSVTIHQDARFTPRSSTAPRRRGTSSRRAGAPTSTSRAAACASTGRSSQRAMRRRSARRNRRAGPWPRRGSAFVRPALTVGETMNAITRCRGARRTRAARVHVRLLGVRQDQRLRGHGGIHRQQESAAAGESRRRSRSSSSSSAA